MYNTYMKKYDFVAIGDTVVDAFIRLTDAEVTCGVDNANCKLSMDFGAKIPFESVTELPAVGNSANASVAAARLGLNAALVTNLGLDTRGDVSIAELQHNNVSTEFIKQQTGKKTNYHYVLWYSDDRTILINHEKYNYELPDFGEPSWVYLSSLGGDTLAYHDSIAEYFEQHPSIKVAFQPGTFQLKLGLERLKKLYAHTEVFICNLEEAQGLLGDTKSSVQELMRRIHMYGPKIVLISDGKRGAYLLSSTGKMYFMPPYPDALPPLERTGAGDAFASTFVSELILGKDILEALRIAPINSMSVVQHIGAQEGLLSQEALLSYLEIAPADYVAQELI